MQAKQRRENIIEQLQKQQSPISATALGTILHASRQLIVGDVAILRAQGHPIKATPRGYVLDDISKNTYRISCVHCDEDVLDELFTIVDCGCGILDVIVEHCVYGEIVGNLHIYSRNDAIQFVETLKNNHSQPLFKVGGDVHDHTLFCPSEKHYEQVIRELQKKGYLMLDTKSNVK